MKIREFLKDVDPTVCGRLKFFEGLRPCCPIGQAAAKRRCTAAVLPLVNNPYKVAQYLGRQFSIHPDIFVAFWDSWDGAAHNAPNHVDLLYCFNVALAAAEREEARHACLENPNP